MNTQQLKCALQQDPVTCIQFGDVCAVDQLPHKIIKRPSVFIVNTDPIKLPGTHWTCFYFPTEGPDEFFDSAGRHPCFYRTNFMKFLEKNTNAFIINNKAIQGLYHPTCGHFCLFYAFHRCRGMSLEYIVDQFSTNKITNDIDVIHFVKSHYNLTDVHCRYISLQNAVCLI